MITWLRMCVRVCVRESRKQTYAHPLKCRTFSQHTLRITQECFMNERVIGTIPPKVPSMTFQPSPRMLLPEHSQQITAYRSLLKIEDYDRELGPSMQPYVCVKVVFLGITEYVLINVAKISSINLH